MSTSGSSGSRVNNSKLKKFFNPDGRINLYGNRRWHKVNHTARALISREPVVDVTGEPINFKPIEGVEKAYEYLLERYVEYVLLLKMMMSSMKRLLHPQKRLLFKRFIEAVACRVCELKNEMIKVSSTNIHNLLGCYPDLGMTPEEIEYHIPDTFVQDVLQGIRLRERSLSLMLKTLESRPDCTMAEILALTTMVGGQGEKLRGSLESSSATTWPMRERGELRDQVKEIYNVKLNDYIDVIYDYDNVGVGSCDDDYDDAGVDGDNDNFDDDYDDDDHGYDDDYDDDDNDDDYDNDVYTDDDGDDDDDDDDGGADVDDVFVVDEDEDEDEDDDDDNGDADLFC
ncbi:IQ and AAA domain-containing protein 1 [Elysia marginata]|uniref:IQ and AAA domain-containing protein 1 n=1 Tax=Elysia marginata TaxID=1093978 RepID=A0AAV4G1L8_9GAST|nr:IQ and AAA domain-containing protein 1 [Elysia marginata]